MAEGLSPLEVMANAAGLADTYHTRVNKMRPDGNYHEVFFHSDPDAVSPVVVAAYPTAYQATQEAARLTRWAEMRSAILALAEEPYPSDILVTKNGRPYSPNIEDRALFHSMLRAIVQDHKSGDGVKE